MIQQSAIDNPRLDVWVCLLEVFDHVGRTVHSHDPFDMGRDAGCQGAFPGVDIENIINIFS